MENQMRDKKENQMRDKKIEEFVKKHLYFLGFRELRVVDLSRGGTMLPGDFKPFPAKDYKLYSYSDHNN